MFSFASCGKNEKRETANIAAPLPQNPKPSTETEKNDAQPAKSQNETSEKPFMYLVCTASAYARASGDVNEVCMRYAKNMGAADDGTDVSIEMILIDNTENEEVFMLSKNICNIAREFDKMRDMCTVSTQGLSGAAGVALCMSYLIGKNTQAVDESRAPLRLLAMVTEDVQRLTVNMRNATQTTYDDAIYWDVCCVTERSDALDVDQDSCVSVLCSNE
ncbi:hypothetical protein CYMTET_35729 [Cymbomonas tetramitiformis]|uniref:Uncharacterized protein n=1 Tax=Cymbomonas tetramitiformis TaxID=36881 RepID=A0AAE0F8N9_9CHLO|nr:hypothetical protein CYMTET_35729 [Cymbomonas tetramitiformis]|eukprot:gene187-328_t